MPEHHASPLTPAQARAALDGIERAAARSVALHRYRQASPFLFVWALVWLLGYGVGGLLPTWSGVAWLLLDAGGAMVCVLLARARFRAVDRRAGWRVAGMGLILAAFMVGSLVVLQPVSGRQVSAFVPLVVAAAYAMAGLWLGVRFILAGCALACLTLLGHVYLGQHFYVWMAVVGGGALALAGLWLRRV